MSLPPLASLAAFIAVAACTSSEPRTSEAPAAPAPAPAAIAERAPAVPQFLPTQAPGVWNPVRQGIGITLNDSREPDAMTVSYRRESGKPAGIALMLAPNACTGIDAFVVRVAATPSQRLTVCLTDWEGVVWTFPTIKAGATVESFTVRLGDLRPDPFQNGGKTIPASPDLGRMKMLTILDISGFMGAPVEECTWTIESVIGEEAAR